MFTAYQNLPDSSRVWVYQSNRAFTSNEEEIIAEKATQFINQWTRHGDDVQGSFSIKYHQFLIVAVDENITSVSGCSIDASVHFVQDLEKILKIDLLNKLNVAFKDNEEINIVSMAAFQQFVKTHKITKDTLVFNNMVQTKKEVETVWEVPVAKSWHQRFLLQ